MNWKIKLLQYKEWINAAAHLIKSIADFSYTKSSLSLISGGVLGISELLGIGEHSPFFYFSSANDWIPVFENELDDLFVSVVNKLPSKDLDFRDPVKYFQFPNGTEFVAIYDGWEKSRFNLMVPRQHQQAVQKLLVQEKLKELNTNIIYVEWRTSDEYGSDKRLVVSPIAPSTLQPRAAQSFIPEITKAFELGLTRSYLLYGPSGTGKSSLAKHLVSHFGLRTIHFRSSKEFSMALMLEFIGLFGIEAIIFDDLDQETIDAELFGFLEIVYSKVKLMFGIVNNLEKLSAAIKRPARFDVLCRIAELDNETVREILGELYDQYGERCQTWPAAFLIELKKSSLLIPDSQFPKKVKELEMRVNEMIKEIGGKVKPSKKTNEKNSSVSEIKGQIRA